LSIDQESRGLNFLGKKDDGLATLEVIGRGGCGEVIRA
jgi:hypothetical protein